MKNFVYKKGSDRIEPSQPPFIIPASSLSMLTHFHKMPIQVGQPVEGERMLFWACTYRNIAEKKINMAAVNMLKSGPIIRVNSQYAETELFGTFAVFHSLRVQ